MIFDRVTGGAFLKDCGGHVASTVPLGVDGTPASTYMLTWRQLEHLCEEQRLVRWRIAIDQPPKGRSLYMVPDVAEAISNRPWPDSVGEKPAHTAERRSAMHSLIRRFVRGDAINLDRDIKDLGSKKAKNEMRGYWEFRSQGRMTETRMFGFFARRGAFVATDFQSRGLFGNEGDPRWLEQRNRCEQTWRDLAGAASYLVSPWPVRIRAQLAEYLVREDV